MARTLYSDEERERRIELIGNYIIETGASIRDVAKYFSDNYFNISVCTVSTYRDLYLKKHPEVYPIIANITKSNKPKTISDDEVRNRVLKVASLIKEGFTIEEISKNLNIDYWVIYDDINIRLKKMDVYLYNEVKKIFAQRSVKNLNNH